VKSQAPPLHVGSPLGGAPQASPHDPQLAVSLWMFTHEPSQFVVPDGQDVVHVPPAQTSSVLHTLVHVPQ
jgi:hypothetical protein